MNKSVYVLQNEADRDDILLQQAFISPIRHVLKIQGLLE